MKSTRFQTQERFFHFASRIPHEAWLQRPNSQRWMIFLNGLAEIQRKEDVKWIAAVLMGTHFHLLFSLQSVDSFNENILMVDLEKWFADALELPMPAFDHPVLCERILSLAQFRHTYKYIYRNPVEASLCSLVQEYPWSSLRELLCPSGKIVFTDSNSLIQNPFQTLKWLNDESNFQNQKTEFILG
jgi:putative transposase